MNWPRSEELAFSTMPAKAEERAMDVKQLQTQFHSEHTWALKFQAALVEQLADLLTSESVALGVPIESRVKTWPSIEEKIKAKGYKLESITDLTDLVGIRLILLFLRDIDTVDRLIRTTFDVLESENTSSRLTETQFGYQSRHYAIKLPKSWAEVPSFKNLLHLKAEIQVRTLAQHIWAAASHKLQYKHEETIPPPLRRTIHRVSALLETVDLEFERVLADRQAYVASAVSSPDSQERLNVDIVQSILDEMLPQANKDDEIEDYADLIPDLQAFEINTADDLRHLINRNLKKVLELDAKTASLRRNDPGENAERLARGVFFTHVGLARTAVSEEFGEEALRDWQDSRDREPC
jgi:putative GTP pyrophosphokinase